MTDAQPADQLVAALVAALQQIARPRRGLNGHETLQQEADYWAYTVLDYQRIARAALDALDRARAAGVEVIGHDG